jgi:hypothetical protein
MTSCGAVHTQMPLILLGGLAATPMRGRGLDALAIA